MGRDSNVHGTARVQEESGLGWLTLYVVSLCQSNLKSDESFLAWTACLSFVMKYPEEMQYKHSAEKIL